MAGLASSLPCVLLASAALADVPNAPTQDLAAALLQLAQRAKIELLFDRNLVSGKRVQNISRDPRPAVALSQLLTGTGLTFRQSDGVYVIVRTPAVQAPGAAAVPDEVAPLVAELLVVGRNTLNADIRRSSDDIQPYLVSSADEIDRARPNSLEDFLRTRQTTNDVPLTLQQQGRVNQGSVRSQVNLRGLGAAQTLVLVDGRRLPSVPSAGDFLQSDLNGLPTVAIDRVETLAGTAGGIFGIGAAGGAVNVVLKRDFEGSQIDISHGVSDRGDAATSSLAGRFGFTDHDARTRVMLAVSYSQDSGLTFADRPYVLDARLQRLARLGPGEFPPSSPSVNIVSTTGALTLAPRLGGGSLTGATTFLPLTATAPGADQVAALKADAGRLDTALAPDGQGVSQSLLTPNRTGSILATVRRNLSSQVDAFVEVLGLEDQGRADYGAVDSVGVLVRPGPNSPFTQPVRISFPTPGLTGRLLNTTRTGRVLAGFIAHLPGGWTANLDAAVGATSVDQKMTLASVGAPTIDVFGGELLNVGPGTPVRLDGLDRTHEIDRMADVNARLAGSLFTLPAGSVDLTLTGEHRWERNPGDVETYQVGSAPVIAHGIAQSQSVDSVFAELRAPVVTRTTPILPLRGLSLQVAVRYDRYAIKVPQGTSGLVFESTTPTALPASQDVTNRAALGSVNLGASVEPVDGLKLRASFAQGHTPPAPNQIAPYDAYAVDLAGLVDSRRRGADGSGQTVSVLEGGSPTIRAARAQTFSAGAVIRPTAAPGFRLSVDYSSLRTTDGVSDFANEDPQYFLDNEQLYGGRVVRAPLTPDDVAKGYSAGRVLSVDTRAFNLARSRLQALDVAADYDRPAFSGALHVYGQASWTLSYRLRDDPRIASYEAVGHADGPLSWRAVVGADWSRGPWSVGLNAQVYSAYRLSYANPQLGAAVNSVIEGQQGGSRIPAQAYLDAIATYRPSHPIGGVRQIYRLSIKNLLGTRPPAVAAIQNDTDHEAIGYSGYGDPRGRRFQVSVSAMF